MSSSPQSAILEALYHGRRDEAARLAEAAGELTIFEAAALGRIPEVERQLAADPGLANAVAPDGYTPLGLAAFFGDAATVTGLLDRGAKVGTASANAMRVQAIHAAVASQRVDSLRVLLARGADVNARQQVGYTPLMAAAGAGREDLVEILLRHGADRTLVSEDGKTAAGLAREHGHEALASRLESPA